MSIVDVRDRIGSLENVLDKVDGVVVDTDKLLEKADAALEVAEKGVAAGKRNLPRIAIGLAVVAAGTAAFVLLRKRRKAAAQWQVLEQPEDTGESMRDVAEGRQDASDLADAADVIDGQQ